MTENIQENDKVYRLEEELNRVVAQLAALEAENRGWSSLNQEISPDSGISLDTLKRYSQLLREEIAASPLPKNANIVRYSYTFSQPFLIPGVGAGSVNSKDAKRGRGRPPKQDPLSAFYNNPVNQRYVFGKSAQELISAACSTDGIYLLVGDDKTKTARAIPISEIAGTYLNPDFPSEVWAYLRVWGKDSDGNPYRKWYFTDVFEGERPEKIPTQLNNKEAENIPVDTGKTIIDFRVGSQVGWSLGIPDLLAGHIWNRTYITLINNGRAVSETLAYFAAKVRSNNVGGARKSGVAIRNTKTAGGIHNTTEGNEIDVFSTAGRTYDFRGLQPVAELYAASVGIAATDLLASPAASGSSYGAATALAPGVRRGIESRRSQIAAWLERVILWGSGVSLQVTPAMIEDIDPYRRAQIVVNAWNTGLIHVDEARSELLYLGSFLPLHAEAPKGVLLPNNEESLERKDIDTDSIAFANTGSGSDPSGNGDTETDISKPSGGDSNLSNDIRQDTIS